MKGIALYARSIRRGIDKLKIETNVVNYTLDDSIKADFFRYAGHLSLEAFLNAVEKKVIKMALQKPTTICRSVARG